MLFSTQAERGCTANLFNLRIDTFDQTAHHLACVRFRGACVSKYKFAMRSATATARREACAQAKRYLEPRNQLLFPHLTHDVIGGEYHLHKKNYRNAWCRFYFFELIKTVMTVIQCGFEFFELKP